MSFIQILPSMRLDHNTEVHALQRGFTKDSVSCLWRPKLSLEIHDFQLKEQALDGDEGFSSLLFFLRSRKDKTYTVATHEDLSTV